MTRYSQGARRLHPERRRRVRLPAAPDRLSLLTPFQHRLALFYGGLVQILAGMWEFAVGNT